MGRPSELALGGASALLAPWRALADPRFFGLEHVPREGPMLLVGNHTVFGLVDLPLMLIGLYEARGTYPRPGRPRALEGPVVGRVPGPLRRGRRDARERTPPARRPRGGARPAWRRGEVAKRKDERYRLIWKHQLGFARIAIERGCPVVPFGSVGAEESFDLLLDADSAAMRPARAMLKRVGLRDDMIWSLARGVGPTVLPRPERFYFSFREPLETTPYGGREGGRAARGLRDRVKRAVEDQIAFCLDERERDPSAISCRVSPPGSRPERVRSQSATATSCPGCGLVLPERRGPSHPHIGASPACWGLYGEVLAREDGEQHYPRWHPLTVDPYVAQHPGEPERRTIRSVAVHLAGRCLAIEHDVPPERAGALIRELLARAPDFRWLDPLRAQAQSLSDVLEAADAADHAERVDQWARAVWKGAIGAPRDDQEVARRASDGP